MPEISVVIPTKDRLPYLQQAIPMFLSHPDVREVVVVVDGCSDGTLDYVKAASASDARIRYCDNVQNKGLPYSRNKGIELASCEYVFTGEDDLELSSDFFSILFAHMEEGGADIISGRNIFRLERESKEDAITRTNRIGGPSINKKLITVNVAMDIHSDIRQPLLPAPMLGRTDLFRKVRFDDGYGGNFWREESDFQLSAVAAGYCLLYCPHAISFNLTIENDRGGVHSTHGVRRVRSIVKNNWRFINKNRQAVAQEFGVTNLRLYIVRFTIWKVYWEIIFPTLASYAGYVLRRRRLHG
jgi:glycosyltransferase involved in cell wall biosynthesis